MEAIHQSFKFPNSPLPIGGLRAQDGRPPKKHYVYWLISIHGYSNNIVILLFVTVYVNITLYLLHTYREAGQGLGESNIRSMVSQQSHGEHLVTQ